MRSLVILHDIRAMAKRRRKACEFTCIRCKETFDLSDTQQKYIAIFTSRGVLCEKCYCDEQNARGIVA